jgi:putative FmdB family regulatory protein
MPRYEYRCRACGDTFEVSRPMSAAAESASCPQGHDDTVKLLSTVALTGRGGGASAAASRAAARGGAQSAAAPSGAAPRAGGGCCGGACGC